MVVQGLARGLRPPGPPVSAQHWFSCDFLFFVFSKNGRPGRREAPQSISFDETSRIKSVWARWFFATLNQLGRPVSVRGATRGRGAAPTGYLQKWPHVQKGHTIGIRFSAK